LKIQDHKLLSAPVKLAHRGAEFFILFGHLRLTTRSTR
jgi:hypothetical protein